MFRSNAHSVSVTRSVFLLIVVVSFASLLLYRGALSKRPEMRAQIMAQDAVSPLAALVSIPVAYVQGGFSGIADRARAHEENIVLREELTQLRKDQQAAQIALLKLTRLEALMGVSVGEAAASPITARAVSEADGPFVKSLLINIGKNKGAEVGFAVMSPEGLNGHVVNVGEISSRVLKLNDLNSRIAVSSLRTGSPAILAGDNSQNPKLAFMQNAALWSDGDSVVTSGDDGELPRGLNIGRVFKDDAGQFRVQVSAYTKPIDWVYVIPFSPIKPPAASEELGP